MKAESVIVFLQLCKDNNIDVVIDGGWGVDALLGTQTRAHNDLDIAVPHEDVARLRELLEEKGYVDILRDDTRDCNFVLGDTANNQIDIHSYTFDENGNNIFGVPYLCKYPKNADSLKLEKINNFKLISNEKNTIYRDTNC